MCLCIVLIKYLVLEESNVCVELNMFLVSIGIIKETQ